MHVFARRLATLALAVGMSLAVMPAPASAAPASAAPDEGLIQTVQYRGNHHRSYRSYRHYGRGYGHRQFRHGPQSYRRGYAQPGYRY